MELIILCFLPGFFICRFMECLIDFKGNKLMKLLAAGGLGVLSNVPIHSGDLFNINAALAAMLLLAFSVAVGSKYAKAAAVMLVFPLIAAMSYIEYNNSFYQQMMQENLDRGLLKAINIRIYVVVIIFVKTVLWAGIYYFFRDRISRIKHYMDKENWLHVIMIGICSLISIWSITVSPPAKYTGSGDGLVKAPFVHWGVLSAVVITDLGVISLLPQMIESVKRKKAEEKAGLIEEYYLSLEEQQEKIKKMRHDMNNHFQMLQTYLSEGNIEKSRDYLEKMDISALNYGGRSFCGDTALNAMLNNRYDRLCETKADVHFNLSIPEIIGIEVTDLCIIFSNSLDNAIEAVRKIDHSKDRKVVLKARYEKGYFSYQLKNSKCNPIQKKNDDFISDKLEKNHGYGIQNIKEIVKKYNGKLSIEYTDHEFILFLYIMEV